MGYISTVIRRECNNVDSRDAMEERGIFYNEKGPMPSGGTFKTVLFQFKQFHDSINYILTLCHTYKSS